MQIKLFDSTEQQTTTKPPIVGMQCYAQVFLGDCLELYKNIEPKSIDLILTDLPYGTTACKWDTIMPFDKLWEMVNYLLKSNGVFITTASQPFTSALVMSNPKMFKYTWAWIKDKAANFGVAKYRPLNIIEDVCVFYNGVAKYNPQKYDAGYKKNKGGKGTQIKGVYGQNGFKWSYDETTMQYPKNTLFFATPKHNDKENKCQHPTQKPVALFEYLIKTYSKEGMIIFDPCMGSGTTGVACKNLNRNFIGIEKDEQYFEIAKQRIISKIIE